MLTTSCWYVEPSGAARFVESSALLRVMVVSLRAFALSVDEKSCAK
jgi:hypothetical protein